MKKARSKKFRPGMLALDGGPDLIVDRALMLVGRDPCCDIRINLPRVSRVHCCLARHRDVIIVRDLGSTNGISVNGRRTGSGLLRPGDQLSIAGFRYRLEVDPDTRVSHLRPHADAPRPRRGPEDAAGTAHS
jgi:predicted component of type VI protein secretion system